MSHICHNLIHGHPTKHGTIVPVDIHTNAFAGEVTIPAVGIADADGCHAGRPCGDVGSAIGNAVTAGQFSHQRNAGGEFQRGAQHSVIDGSHGGHAVKQQAGPRQIGTGNFVAQLSCTGRNMAVAEVEMRMQRLNTAVEKLYLILRKRHIFISRGEMRHDAIHLEIRHGLHLRNHRGQLLR